MENKELTSSPFDEKTLQYFKEIILDKRQKAKEEAEKIERSISDLNQADDADSSSISHHMGDIGSETEERQLNYVLLERTRKYIGKLNEALERIENGTYGICKVTGKPISKGRLEAVPHTRYTVEAKKQGKDKLNNNGNQKL